MKTKVEQIYARFELYYEKNKIILKKPGKKFNISLSQDLIQYNNLFSVIKNVKFLINLIKKNNLNTL